MAKQRYINTRFWSDNFVSELNPLDRYLFLYFLTNEHTNICGIYEVPLKTISFETGIEVDMLKKMLKRLDGKVYYIDGWVYIKNFEKHQAINESVVKGIEIAKKEVPEKIMSKIEGLRQGVDRVSPESPHDPTYLNPNPNVDINLNSLAISKIAGDRVNKFLETWKDINPNYKSFYANKTQRAAAEWFIKQYGEEKAAASVEYLKQTNILPYAPKITTPHELRRDLAKLVVFIKQEQNKKGQKTNKFAFL